MDKHSGSDIKMNSEAKADRARPTVQIREGTTTYTRTEHMSHVACCMKLLLPPKKRAKTMAQAMKPIQRGRQSVANPRKTKPLIIVMGESPKAIEVIMSRPNCCNLGRLVLSPSPAGCVGRALLIWLKRPFLATNCTRQSSQRRIL